MTAITSIVAASLASSVLALATPVSAGDAEPSQRLVWRWNRFNAIDYVSTAALGLTWIAIELGSETPAEPNWRGGILCDDEARDLLAGGSRESRDAHSISSDYLAVGTRAVLVFDSVAVPLFFDDWNGDVAWQLLMIDLQVQAITTVVSRVGHHWVARERPDVEPCKQDDDYDSKCFAGMNASFPSGHVAGSVGAAGVNCIHHDKLALYGHPAADGAACAFGLTMAALVGVQRVIADRHWTSDVLLGAGLGLGAGVALPLVAHYRPRDGERAVALRWTIAPAPDGSLGLSVHGWM